MPMNVSAYLRHPLLLLAAVSLAVGLIWYLLGLPVQMPRSPLPAGEKIGCVAYAPTEIGEGEPVEISLARIEADLAALAPHTSCIRTYRTGAGLDRVVDAAAGHGMKVLLGLSVGRDAAENRAEVERAVVAAEVQRGAIMAFVVGDRVLSRRGARLSDLTGLIRELRERTRLPVTSAELAEAWLEADQLAAAVDFVLLRVPLYDALFPSAAGSAATATVDARARVVAEYPDKQEAVEAGWPSAGRMREQARPSPSSQARVTHDLLAAARTGRFQLVLFEGIDNPARAAGMGTAASHWGLMPSAAQPPKFILGDTVINHPLWFTQGATGIMLVLVIFAAAFLGARSAGPHAVETVKWWPIGLIALAASPLFGWAIAELPIQSHTAGEWILGSTLLLLAVITPAVCAAVIIRRLPFEGFGALLDPAIRRHAHPLARAAGMLFAMTVFVALAVGLILVFDPAPRDLPFAPLTGPAVAIAIMALTCPAGLRSDSVAEKAAALVLVLAAALIVFNESLWNWQAAWLAALFVALAVACRRSPAARNP
jgi:exo-beta-1,3-glucanase (GH17 family)